LTIKEIINKTKAYYCLECGRCTGSCPVARIDRAYSPRLVVERALMGFESEVVADKGLWSCITCDICNSRCPSGVDYTGFIKAARANATKIGNRGICTHGGVISSLMHIMTNPNLRQDRLWWVGEDLKISPKGEILYFVGCLPYFETIFKDIKSNSLSIAISVIKIFNQLGIAPVVMNDERCCGHDLLWTGDVENFEKLAKLNIDLIQKTGAKKVVTSCAECYRTLKLDYPEYVGGLDFEVVHISEFLAELIDKGEVEFNRLEEKITYHDPCRLGRHLGVYDSPRKVIGSIPGIKFAEMERNKSNSACCGTSAWINCDMFSEEMRRERLEEAKATGADTLITACPKCQIHFNCTLSNDDMGIKIKDITNLIAEAIKGSGT
jgi:Fe-S oxidoreductase